VCDSDIDNDGILDGDESFIDSEFPDGVPGAVPENDGGSIGDQDPPAEPNMTGTITSLSGEGFTLSGEVEGQSVVRSYVVTASTRYTSCGLTRRDKCDLGRYRVGDEVRVLAYANGASLFAYAVFGSILDGERR
jgi:hypothetical protein